MRCDTHVHIVGPADRYPQVPERTYLADVAPVEELRRRGATRGVSRFVIVQPSFYGTDNTATLEALDVLGQDGRGVAVIDPQTISQQTLDDYAKRGVRGLRINLYSPMKLAGSKGLSEDFAATAHIARLMKWHVQVIAPLPVLLQATDLMGQAPVPVVVDHYGLYGQARPDSGQGRRLIDLMRRPHVWMKLSAPYRLDGGPLNTKPDPEWLAVMLEIAPGRCVWGSDWPHPPSHEEHKGKNTITPYRPLSYETLMDDFLAALPSPDFADVVLRDNPAKLYGF